MSHATDHRSTYRNYPFLDKEEFAEACHFLDSKYCQARLGPLRRQWRLGVHSGLDMSFGMDSGYATFVQISRPLEDTANLGDLEATLNSFTMTEAAGNDAMSVDMVMDSDEDDQEIIIRHPSKAKFGYVRYEIHWHPTYRAPCLWFSLHDLPGDESAFDIDTVFRRLVPDQYKDALRRTGTIGGISADHHPLTGVPSFFVHPCLLSDAMAGFDCPKEDYLMVWLGLVGGCVGLWVPKEMAFSNKA
ncbi:autophagocytosis associated protein- active-site domain-containing protein [Apiospora aurea]|uniref:Ubiquitin-like-conjugating enzyme ATG10 n=1 Tax=Apiospora aurea TaxID=335848 RepID=A0ABR1QD07_9PEZI